MVAKKQAQPLGSQACVPFGVRVAAVATAFDGKKFGSRNA
jgi:hypothetical protein